MKTEKRVDLYIVKKEQWAKELELLRETLICIGLEETLKWGAPVYVDNSKNVVGLAAFKNYVGLWFFQGVFLTDKHHVLFNAQEGKTIAMRQWRFSNFDEIAENLEWVEEYVQEATQNMREGKVMIPAPKKPLVIPEELELEFAKNLELKQKFEELNLTRKREFVVHIAGAKRAQTKQTRLNKIIPMIFQGVGLGDKYRK